MITVKVKATKNQWESPTHKMKDYRKWCNKNAKGWTQFYLSCAEGKSMYAIFEFPRNEDAIAFKLTYKEAQ